METVENLCLDFGCQGEKEFCKGLRPSENTYGKCRYRQSTGCLVADIAAEIPRHSSQSAQP